MEEFYEAPRIEIIFSIHNLEKSGLSHPPHTKLRFHYSEDNQTYNFVGETELIEKSYNPTYKTPLEHNYVFEVTQYVKVEVLNLVRTEHSEVLSSLIFSIGTVMGCPGQTSKFSLERKKNEVIGELVVHVHEFAVERDTAIIQCSGHKLPKKKGLTGTVNPYLTFYRNEGSEWIAVYQTEAIFDTHGDANWISFELKLHKLCSNNKDAPLRVECCHKSKKEKKKLKIYGEFKTTVNRLLAGEKEYELERLKSKKKKYRGQIVFNSFQIVERYNLLDYLKGGLKLNLLLGVDFTSSNGDPKFLDSLHSLCNPGKMNQYQTVLYEVCSILTHYIHDKQILPLGFGAKPMFPKFCFQRTHNCFPMTGDPAVPFVVGLNGVMQAYFNTLLHVQLFGPTFISYVIEEGIRKASYHKQKGNWEYSIMLIITDGDIHDLERTLPLIQQSSVLPISYIIIGVGDEKFEEMSAIHGYNARISKVQTTGQSQVYRDCSQFVKFRDYASNPQKFARILLSRIPSQICEYMRMLGLKPSQQVKIDLNSLTARASVEDIIEYQPDKMFWEQFSQKKTTNEEVQTQTKTQILAEQHDPILRTASMNQSSVYQPILVQQNNVTDTKPLQQVPSYMHFQQHQNFGIQQSYYQQQQPQYIPQQPQYIPQQPQYISQQQYYPQQQQFPQQDYIQQQQFMQQQQQFVPQQQIIPQQFPNQSNVEYPSYPMQQQPLNNYNPNANLGYTQTQTGYPQTQIGYQDYPQDYQKPQSLESGYPQMTNLQQNVLIQADNQRSDLQKSEIGQLQPRLTEISDTSQDKNHQNLSQQADPFLSKPNQNTEKPNETNETNTPVNQQDQLSNQQDLNGRPIEDQKDDADTNRVKSQAVYSTDVYEKDGQDDTKSEIIASFDVDKDIEKTEETELEKKVDQPEEELPTLKGVIRQDSVYSISPHHFAKDL